MVSGISKILVFLYYRCLSSLLFPFLAYTLYLNLFRGKHLINHTNKDKTKIYIFNKGSRCMVQFWLIYRSILCLCFCFFYLRGPSWGAIISKIDFCSSFYHFGKKLSSGKPKEPNKHLFCFLKYFTKISTLLTQGIYCFFF